MIVDSAIIVRFNNLIILNQVQEKKIIALIIVLKIIDNHLMLKHPLNKYLERDKVIKVSYP